MKKIAIILIVVLYLRINRLITICYLIFVVVQVCVVALPFIVGVLLMYLLLELIHVMLHLHEVGLVSLIEAMAVGLHV